MRRLLCALAAVCVAAPAFAQSGGTKGNGAPKGKFDRFLLVAPGNPNNMQTELTNFLTNDASNGRAIFIPVRTAHGPKDAIAPLRMEPGLSSLVTQRTPTSEMSSQSMVSRSTS